MKIFNKVLIVLFTVVMLTPMVSSASYACGATSVIGGNPTSNNLAGQVCNIINFINGYIIPLMVAIALGFFVYGVIKYIMAHDEDKRKEGREVILYGVIGFAVIVGVWGLVQIVSNTFGLQAGSQIQQLPTL